MKISRVNMGRLKSGVGLLVCAFVAGCATSKPVESNVDLARAPMLLRGVPFTQVTIIDAGNGQRLVNAIVNGQPGVFAVDTGAEYTIITPQFAGKLGILKTAPKGRAIDNNGRSRTVGFANIGYLRLGGFDYAGFYAPILNLDHINRAMHSDIAGIIGNDLLAMTACSMDWAGNTLTLDARELTPPPDAIEIAVRGNRIYVPALVNGFGCDFALDTGAYRSLISESEVSRLQIPDFAKQRLTALRIDLTEARQVKQTQVLLGTFKAGKIERANYSMLVWRHNVIGMDLLHPWVLSFDTRKGWMSLTAPSGQAR